MNNSVSTQIQPEKSNINNKNEINIPITLILSDLGVSVFLQKKRKLQRFNLANNKVGYGTSLSNYDIGFLQKMMFNGYIRKMEMSVKTGAIPDRRNLISLTKITTKALLYRQFYNMVQAEIFSSDLIRQWNRNNLKRPIDSKTRFNAEFLGSFKESNQGIIKQISGEIESSVYEYLQFHPEMRQADRELLISICKKYVAFLGTSTFFLLSIKKGSPDSKQLMLKIKETLKSYLDKSIVAEYLSLLLVELLVYLRPEVFRDSKFSEPGDITIGYNYSNKGWSQNNDRLRMNISIYDKVMLQKSNVQQAISDRVNRTTQEVSLKEFYENAEDNIAIAGLGLYYLSYLKDVCNDMDIVFESLVSHIPGQETEVKLSMRF